MNAVYVCAAELDRHPNLRELAHSDGAIDADPFVSIDSGAMFAFLPFHHGVCEVGGITDLKAGRAGKIIGSNNGLSRTVLCFRLTDAVIFGPALDCK